MKNKVDDLAQGYLISSFDLLISVKNNELNGLTKKKRNKLDTIISKLDILINDIMYQGGEK